MFTNMEIWDKAKYDERVNAISTEELAQGVEELFSGLSFGL
jgi:DNA-binding transcriptional regulator/RsmH inhibitor MraZ